MAEATQIATKSLDTIPHTDNMHSVLEATHCELLFQQYLVQPAAASYNNDMNAARRHSQRNPLKTIDGPRQVSQVLRRVNTAFDKKTEQQEMLPFGDVSFMTQQCEQILDLDTAPVGSRVQAGMILGPLLGAMKQWTRTNKVHEKTIGLLRRLVVPSLSRVDQEWLLRRLSNQLPTMAGYAALYATEAAGSTAEEAVLSFSQHLESGRGMLARLMFQSRMNLEHFRQTNEEAAAEYHRLLNQLSLLESDSAIMERERKDSISGASVVLKRGEIAARMSELKMS